MIHREQLGGDYLIDVPDLDAVISLGHGLPTARERHGTAEARPARIDGAGRWRARLP